MAVMESPIVTLLLVGEGRGSVPWEAKLDAFQSTSPEATKGTKATELYPLVRYAKAPRPQVLEGLAWMSGTSLSAVL